MSDAFDNLHNALDRLWESIIDAFTVRVWHDRLALWQVLIAIDLIALIAVGILTLLGYLR